jgi:TonB family protein
VTNQIRTVLVALTIVLGVAPSAAAQTRFAGVVLDPEGQPANGIPIYMTNVASKSQVELTTPEDGRFDFSGFSSGDYRITSTAAGFAPFTVTLANDDPVIREIRLTFGPFRAEWTIVEPASAAPAPSPPPPSANYRCSEPPLPPFCGPESLMQEFELAQAERLKSRWLPPVLMLRVGEPYPPALLAARLEGVVTMEARLGADGVLNGLRIVAADHPALGDEALQLANRAVADPARVRGTPQEVSITIRVRFRLLPR